MKHHFFKKAVCLLAAAVMTLACAVTAYAYDEDYGYVSVRVDNAPEGTAYVDLLVPVFDLPEDHFKTHEYTFSLKKLNYENENESPSGDKKKLVVGTDSETAQYIEDGYVSLLSHTDLVYPDGFSVTSSYKDNKRKGMAKVTLKGIGAYAGTKTLSFKIVEKNVNYKGVLLGADWR